MSNRVYKPYLSGLKGAACLLIMLGHFVDIYMEAESFAPGFPMLDAAMGSPLAFLMADGYWLYLFFVVSGYLVAQSSVRSGRDVIRKAIGRFLRFAVPVLFSCFVIWGIGLLVGFHAAQTEGLFSGGWFQSFYRERVSFREVLLSPVQVMLVGKSPLNAPYWVLKDMLLASVLIYVCRFGCSVWMEKHPAFCLSALMLTAIVLTRVSAVIAACFLGMLLSVCEDAEIRRSPAFAFWMMASAMLLYVLPKTLLSAVSFAALVLCIPRVPWLDRLFSSRIFQYLGKISWGIYSFHWPLMCSVGAWLLLRLSAQWGLRAAYGTACAAAAVLTLLLSAAYAGTLEKLSARITKAVEKRL